MSEPYTTIPLTPLRKAIAVRMSEATRTVPHFRLVADIEMDALLGMRVSLRTSDPTMAAISINDLLIKCCATALMDVPAVNVQWAETAIHQYTTADISIVTAVEGGLAAPIIRRAESKSVAEISREVEDLVTRAAAGAVRMSDISGGSFSLSNLGMYTVDQFDAIINSPQCAMLAVGRIWPRILVTDCGSARVAKVMRATLSVDHRAIDGVLAAKFLSAVRSRMEQPEYLIRQVE